MKVMSPALGIDDELGTLEITMDAIRQASQVRVEAMCLFCRAGGGGALAGRHKKYCQSQITYTYNKNNTGAG